MYCMNNATAATCDIVRVDLIQLKKELAIKALNYTSISLLTEWVCTEDCCFVENRLSFSVTWLIPFGTFVLMYSVFKYLSFPNF